MVWLVIKNRYLIKQLKIFINTSSQHPRAFKHPHLSSGQDQTLLGLRVPPQTCSFLPHRELAESGDEEMISPIKGVLHYFEKPFNELPRFLSAYVQLSLKVGDQLFLGERHTLSVST